MIFFISLPPYFFISVLSLSSRARLLTTAGSKVVVSKGRPTPRIPLSNDDRREKDADARRWKRGINNRRRSINRSRSVPVGPIQTTAAIIVPTRIIVPAAIIVPAGIIVPAALLWSLSSPIAIFAERRSRRYTADHGGENKRQQDLTDD